MPRQFLGPFWMAPLVAACGSSSHAAADAGVVHAHDASVPPDALADAPSDAIADVDKAATCVDAFGEALTFAFGRADGTVVAVVPPGDEACALPNSTHLIVELSLSGVVYRMVLDVLSDVGNPDVFFYEEDAPLAAGPWVAGWHPGVAFDYVTTLGLHSTSFTEMNEASLVTKVTSELALGAHVSVFATSDGEYDSAHLIHRNVTGQDGAIVIGPDTPSPQYLLFRFDEQVF